MAPGENEAPNSSPMTPAPADTLIMPLYPIPINAFEPEEQITGINRLDQILRKAESGEKLTTWEQVMGQRLYHSAEGAELERQEPLLLFRMMAAGIPTAMRGAGGSLSGGPGTGAIATSHLDLDDVQTSLDVIGVAPGVGEFADGLNAAISLFRGDFVGAGLSAVSMIPVIGDAIGKGGKVARYIGRESAEHGDEVLRLAKPKATATDELVIINQIKCFAPETLVTTRDGQKPICEVHKGDEVLAYDFRQGRWVVDEVAERHDNLYDGPVVTVHTNGGSIETTVYHPFWVSDGRDLDERSVPRELAPDEDQGFSLFGRWVNSHELRAGDKLIGSDGNTRAVLRVEQRYESQFRVCNLTIARNHSFAVGLDALLVHNTTECDEIAEAFRKLEAPIREVTHLHHAWPKYLGGPSKQDLVRLPKSVHDAYHSGLDKILPRQWGTKYYDNLSGAARKQLERDLADYTKAFDTKYGTNLWQSMLNNGFPGQ